MHNKERDIDLIELLLKEDSGVKIVSDSIVGRLETDVREALEAIINDYWGVNDEYDQVALEKDAQLVHIKRLERMLESRDVKFKSWDEIS